MNPPGDEEVPTHGFAPHPPLTLYDPVSRHGYKVVAASKDGRVPAGALAEIAAWVEAGRLPDGTPLEAVGIILPAREAALKIREQARAAGVSRVVYTDNKRTLWDPFPPGDERG